MIQHGPERLQEAAASAAGSDSWFGPLLTVQEVLRPEPFGRLADYDPCAVDGLARMARYVAEFLTAGHAQLGRSGAVCPFAAAAAELGLIRLTACSAAVGDEAAITQGMNQLRRALAELEPDPKPDDAPSHRAIVAVFPALSEPAGARLIERIQKALKASFVENRLMIGQFFPSCSEPGLWNRDFRPLQSPVISLAIRNITIFDAPFMLERAEYAEAFVRIFGEAGRKRIAKAARDYGHAGEGARAGAALKH